jgi:hypothetical protein
MRLPAASREADAAAPLKASPEYIFRKAEWSEPLCAGAGTFTTETDVVTKVQLNIRTGQNGGMCR